MRPQINRLPVNRAEGFGEAAIDRNRALRFRLDGRLVSGFAGDSVLSAALASGIDTLGLHEDYPLGLTPSADPAISLAGHANDPHFAMPMARVPAIDGADLVTLGARRINPLARLLLPGRTLGLTLGGPHVLEMPWRGLASASQDGSDLVVVGGGVAGMEAALSAAAAGLRVTLVEASGQLGGHSGLFGTQDGEVSPEADMARLRAAVTENDAVSVLTHSHAYALRPGLVRIHRVVIVDGVPQGGVSDLATRFVIIATGSQERLPIFAGNRLPGVIGVRDAYELAARYHVWPGETALLATGSNVAYRLAMLASDAEIRIGRLLDSRPNPNSRFIAFSRAYGMVQTPGAAVELANIAKAGGTLSVHTSQDRSEALVTERLLLCGGWQPDLTLWHIAGGISRWNPLNHRLEAHGHIDGLALAGSAAGYFTRRGCMESGRDAVLALLNRPRKTVNDPVIDPLHESPDAQPSIGTLRDDAAPAYLDHGHELVQRPAPQHTSWTRMFRRQPPRTAVALLSHSPQPLSLGTVVAGVDLGLIPAESAGNIAHERVALVVLPSALASEVSDGDQHPIPDEVPSYLEGRFGEQARIVHLTPDEARQLSSGALIYRRSDPPGPFEAIGVVLRPAGKAALALMAGDAARSGLEVTVLDQGRPVPVRIEVRDLSD